MWAGPAGTPARGTSTRPSAGQVVDARSLMGGDDRVARHEQADAASDPEPRGRLGGSGQRNEQLVGVPVLSRELSASRIWSDSRCRDVGVLGEEQRLLPAV